MAIFEPRLIYYCAQVGGLFQLSKMWQPWKERKKRKQKKNRSDGSVIDMSDSMLRSAAANPDPCSRIQSYPDDSSASGDGDHGASSSSSRATAGASKLLSSSPNASSPLQLFVRAKKKINEIYTELGEYVGSAGRFLSTSSEIARDPSRPLLDEAGRKRVEDFERKATAIQVQT